MIKRLVKKNSGFTLIELLIVVAIIAILAAIAIPNFLAAQVRAKVSRTLGEYHSMNTAIESFYVDNNRYPATRNPQPLTTPIAYMTSLPKSPWKEISAGLDPNEFTTLAKTYIYVSTTTGDPPQNYGNNPADLKFDYFVYIRNVADPAQIDPDRVRWELKSVGPDGQDDRTVLGLNAQMYDPTNGTVSPGDIVWFNDGTGNARGR